MAEIDDELRTLNAGIATVDSLSAPPPDPDAPAEKTPQDAAAAWAEIPAAVGMLITHFLPALKPVYAEDQCREWGRHMAKVADKYGWSNDGLPPEVAALMSTGMFVVPTFMAVKALKDKPKEVTNGEANPPA